MKPATKTLAGFAKMSCGTRHLLDDAVAHDRDPVGDGERLDLVVGHDHGGLVQAVQQLLDLAPHLLADGDVEAAQRLVEEEALRIADDRAPHGDPLLLALREPAGNAVQRMGEVEQAGDLLHPAVDLLGGDLLGVEREGQVLRHRQAGIEGVELEHHGDVAIARREVVDPRAGDEDVARRHVLEPCDHAERRGLAAAGRPEQAHHLAGFHVEVDVVDRGERAEVLGEVAQLDVGHGRATA